MKRILLDTHALIWWFDGDEKLGENAIQNIANPDNIIFVSAATVWEMSIKQQMGKLIAPDDIESKIEQAGRLPLHHKDPFDRMLIAQAQAEGLEILTKDEHLPAYGVKLINASI